MADAPEVRFVRALAAGLLAPAEQAARAAAAHGALAEALAERRSLVLEVQFTGFAQKGQLVGGVDPAVLRAAAHLIMLRVNRVGFTADASPADVEAFLRAASRAPGELGEAGVLGAVAQAAPYGVYVGTTAGQGYRPPPRPAADDASDGPEPAAPVASPAATWAGDAEEETELGEFEILDPVQVLGAAAAAAPAAPTPAQAPREAGEPAGADMYHYFRTADAPDADAARLPGLLAAADSMARFDELAEAAARSVQLLLRADAHADAISLLDALVREAERADRTRFFRESAVQALRRAGTPDTLHRLLELLAFAGPERARILRVFAFLGGDALLLLEPLLYRGGDAVLRGEVLRVLAGTPPVAEKLVRHAVDDPSPARARALLEAAREAGMDAEVVRAWAGKIAAHGDPVARVEAARTVAALGGRGAIRALVELLGDPERVVRREAIAGLGGLGDAAAVPFLARVLAEGGDEEMQCAAAAALGRLGAADAVPPLLALVRKRSLLPIRRSSKAKLVALQALARIPAPAARDALQAVASGRDDLADEARRLLAG